jgi:hypothetical protein
MMQMEPVPHGLSFNETVLYKLGQIETKIKAIDDKLEDITSLKTDVANLKLWRSLTIGMASGVSFVIGLIIKVAPWPS